MVAEAKLWSEMTLGIVLRGYESDVNGMIRVALFHFESVASVQKNGPAPRFNPPAPGRPVPHKFLIRKRPRYSQIRPNRFLSR